MSGCLHGLYLVSGKAAKAADFAQCEVTLSAPKRTGLDRGRESALRGQSGHGPTTSFHTRWPTLTDITTPARYRGGGCNPRICRASFGVATWSPNTSMILPAFSTSAALLGAILPFSR